MSSQRLEISLEVRNVRPDGIAFVKPSGDVDLANAEELGAALRSPRCLESGGVVLDLSDVPFMDSSGIAVILRALHELDARLAVVVAEGSVVARLFELTGVSDRLRPVASEREALEAIDAAGLDGPG